MRVPLEREGNGYLVFRIISPRNFNVQVGDVVWKHHEVKLHLRFIPSTRYSESTQDPTLDSFTSSTKGRILAGGLTCRSLPVCLLKLMKMGLALTHTALQPKLGSLFLTIQIIAMVCKPLPLQSATHLVFIEHYRSSISSKNMFSTLSFNDISY